MTQDPLGQPRPGHTPAQAIEIALSLHRQGRLGEAERVYRAILQVKPTHVGCLINLGKICCHLGRPREAEGFLRQAVAIDRHAPDAHNCLGIALAAQGRSHEALAEYDKAVDLAPTHFEALSNLGIALLPLRRPQEALAHFEKALALKADSAEAYNNVGTALAALNRHGDAVTHYERALAIRPNFAVAHHNLGSALAALGRLEQAVNACEKAIALEPNWADAHCNVAKLLVALKQYDAAIDHFQKALPITGNVAETHNSLGTAHAAMERYLEAVAHFDKALALRPDFAEAHNNLGNVMAALDRQEEAVPHFENALRLMPDFTEAMNNLGQTLAVMNRTQDSLACFQNALAGHPDLAEAHNGLGNVLQTLGRLDESQSAFETAVKLAPGKAEFHRGLAMAKKFTAADPHIAAMEELARGMASLSDKEQVALHFALGKAYADLGRHEQSFRHLLAGNAIKRRLLRYDEAAELARLHRIKAVFTPELIRQKHNLGDPSDLPVFIIGMPRSGTTLIEQVLASHPKVFGAGELRAITELLTEFDRKSRGRPPFPEVVPQLGAEELRRLGAQHVGRIKSLAPAAERITDKMPGNFPFAGFIHLVLPRARIIHARRDPVDTCVSCFSHLFIKGALEWTYNLVELGRYYRAYAALMNHWRAVLPEGAMLEVQYEDVVADFEPQARRLVAFCGLEWDDRCLAFHKTERPVRTASAVQVRQPLYRSSVGRWRPYKEMLQPLLAELGGE